MVTTIKHHWPEYLIEAWGLGIFMVAACFATAFLWYPSSPVHEAIPSPLIERVLMGLAMGLTAVAITYSKWGQRSGAHINPALTLTFLRLGKIKPIDAAFYILFQFAGGVAGVWLSTLLLGSVISAPAVNYAVTVPGSEGAFVAFLAECVISFGLMLVVLATSNSKHQAHFTGLFAGALIALYITFESPLSGMSMNPARTVGSAITARVWTASWVYFTAPIVGMLLAAEVYVRLRGLRAVKCAKLKHPRNDPHCIFCCGYREEHHSSA